MPYAETIHFLYRLQRNGIRPGLSRMAALLSLCQHPERSFHAVHIGGTNGKGSTAVMVASILKQAGYRVGSYTSPHLIDFSERICLSGQPISEDSVMRLTEDLREKMAFFAPWLSKEVTFFEFTTALAFLYFSEEQVDFAVVEVGMGGRFDTTNLLRPLVTAITNIDLDHEQYLGSEVLQIAAEKGGIIKEKTPVITAASRPEVVSLLRAIAQSKNAPLIQVGQEIKVALTSFSQALILDQPVQINYQGARNYQIDLPLLGRHQVQNAAVAIGIIESLSKQGVHLSEGDIQEGMRAVHLSGRLEVVRRDPLILLDGAHNPAGARALGLFLEEMDPARQGKHWLMIGMMQDKKMEAILAPLLPWADEAVLCQPKMARAASPEMMAAKIRKLSHSESIRLSIREGVPEALSHLESLIKPQDTLLITGSFYVVGEAKAALCGKAPSLIRG